MVASDESQVLGCSYFFPTDKVEYDVEVFLWVRESEVVNDLCGVLFEVVQRWLTSQWHFDDLAYPGRKISGEHWNSLPEK